MDLKKPPVFPCRSYRETRVSSGSGGRYTGKVLNWRNPAIPSLTDAVTAQMSPQDLVLRAGNDYRAVIIGAGPQGIHLAIMLVAEAGLDPASILLVDREAGFMGNWNRLTAATGMSHLRSSSVHHVDVEPPSLRRFRHRRAAEYPEPYADPYRRPALSLFNEHALWAAKRWGIADRIITDDIRSIRPNNRGYRLTASRKSFSADNLILAPGQGAAHRPSWTENVTAEVQIRHLFDQEFDRQEWADAAASGEPIRIIGAGISALQAALSLSGNASDGIDLFASRMPETWQFDSHPGWIGPRFASGFHRITDTRERRRIISEARRPGSADPETIARFNQGCRTGQIRFHRGEPESLGDEILRSAEQEGGRILLATGYSKQAPLSGSLADLSRTTGAPVAADGYPIPDRHLAWLPGLFVAGALAELEIGPPARNIAGARRVAERICTAWIDSAQVVD